NRVWLDDYCTQVVEAMRGFAGMISVEAEMEALEVDVRVAAPLALILTELLTNVFKYAFAGRSQGLVSITLARGEGEARLSVRDDGIGLPPGFDPLTQPGMGLELIRGLVSQVKGEFSIEGDASGTLAKVSFPLSG
ncbi:MAG: sensor histidine kinase, partial [Spirochaetota bacterium]